MRRKARQMCKAQWMFWFILILVFLNTCVLATEHHSQPLWLDDFQEYTNLFFVCLFTIEMLLKMYALGFSGYMVSLFNRFKRVSFCDMYYYVQVRLCCRNQFNHGVCSCEPTDHAPRRPLRASVHPPPPSFQSHQVCRGQADRIWPPCHR